MFPYPIATPQKCNIQTFYGSGDSLTSSEGVQRAWNKPVGVSHVYIMLIGAGGNGTSVTGGGSGTVTVWYGAAQHVPGYLMLEVAATQGQNTRIRVLNAAVQQSILVASSATNDVGGLVNTATAFANTGFYKSTAGQTGTSTNVGASTNTFLGAGGGAPGTTITSNYGYSSSATLTQGFFQMQPIIVGGGGSSSGNGGIGCGGGKDGKGGQGMILIASW